MNKNDWRRAKKKKNWKQWMGQWNYWMNWDPEAEGELQYIDICDLVRGRNHKPQPTTNGKQIDNVFFFSVFVLSRELCALSNKWQTAAKWSTCALVRNNLHLPHAQPKPKPPIHRMPFSIFCGVPWVAGREAFWHSGDIWLCSITFDLCCIWHLL